MPPNTETAEQIPPDIDELCLDVVIKGSSRPKGKNIAFYVFVNKEKSNMWHEDDRMPALSVWWYLTQVNLSIR